MTNVYNHILHQSLCLSICLSASLAAVFLCAAIHEKTGASILITLNFSSIDVKEGYRLLQTGICIFEMKLRSLKTSFNAVLDDHSHLFADVGKGTF